MLHDFTALRSRKTARHQRNVALEKKKYSVRTMSNRGSIDRRGDPAANAAKPPLAHRPEVAIGAGAAIALGVAGLLSIGDKLKPEASMQNDEQIVTTSVSYGPSDSPDESSMRLLTEQELYVLRIIHALNAGGAVVTSKENLEKLTPEERIAAEKVNQLDKSGDDEISPIDALLSINDLNELYEAIMRQCAEARAKVAANTVFK